MKSSIAKIPNPNHFKSDLKWLGLGIFAILYKKAFQNKLPG